MGNKSWTTWLIADPHFFHDNVLDFCDRPFKNVNDMNNTIINNINKVVMPEDLLIFVGDVIFYKKVNEMKLFLSKINCKRLILVKGNHDKKARQMVNAGFDLCVDEMVMTIAGEKVTISHYPFRMPKWKYRIRMLVNKIKKKIGWKRIQWPEKYHNRRPVDRGQFLIHGHTHRKQKTYGRSINVGVDAWDFKPVNIQDISNLMFKIKKYEKKDGRCKTRSIQ